MAGSVEHGRAIIAADISTMVERVVDIAPALDGTTIAVTGAAGMLGGYVADLAVGLNDSGIFRRPMRIVLATRQAPTVGSRLGHLSDRDDVEILVTGSSGEPDLHSSPDFVVYAASPASPRDFLADPIGTLEANSTQLRRWLDDAARGGAAGFAYISTSEVYGDPPADAIPTPETFIGATDPTAERASYVEAKRFGEALCMAYHRQRGLPTTILRPFHVHGPGLRIDDGRIIAALMEAAVAGRQFRLASDGTATRCYGYVADVVVGIYRAMVMTAGQVFNIGVDGPETSVIELATIVAEIAGAPPPVTTPHVGPVHLHGAPARSRPDLGSARLAFGYETAIALEDGLGRTYAWFRQRYGTAR